jgi:hypothetical protein
MFSQYPFSSWDAYEWLVVGITSPVNSISFPQVNSWLGQTRDFMLSLPVFWTSFRDGQREEREEREGREGLVSVSWLCESQAGVTG